MTHDDLPGTPSDHAELDAMLKERILLAGGEAAIDIRQRLCAAVWCDRRAICSHNGIPLCGKCMARLENEMCKPVWCKRRKPRE